MYDEDTPHIDWAGPPGTRPAGARLVGELDVFEGERVELKRAHATPHTHTPPATLPHPAWVLLRPPAPTAPVPGVLRISAGKLTEDEWEVMRTHPYAGIELLRSDTIGPLVMSVVRHHHERWDGAGYPDGLRGERIPIGARMVGLVDAYDAIIHDRPYRPARPVEEALRELEREAGADDILHQLSRWSAGIPVTEDHDVFQVRRGFLQTFISHRHHSLKRRQISLIHSLNLAAQFLFIPDLG